MKSWVKLTIEYLKVPERSLCLWLRLFPQRLWLRMIPGKWWSCRTLGWNGQVGWTFVYKAGSDILSITLIINSFTTHTNVFFFCTVSISKPAKWLTWPKLARVKNCCVVNFLHAFLLLFALIIHAFSPNKSPHFSAHTYMHTHVQSNTKLFIHLGN